MKKLIMMMSLLMAMVFVGSASNVSAQYVCIPNTNSPVGRVVDSNGRGIKGVVVTVTTIALGHPSNVEPLTRTSNVTNTLGYYTSYSPYPLCAVSSYMIQGYSPRYGYTNSVFVIDGEVPTLPDLVFP